VLGFSVFLAGIAAQEGHEACVRALLTHGADPNHSDRCGRNALRVAVKSGHDSVVRLLEEFNASQKQQLGRPGISGGEKCYVSLSNLQILCNNISLYCITLRYKKFTHDTKDAVSFETKQSKVCVCVCVCK